MQLQASTEPGRRFAALGDEHAAAFRARLAAYDTAGALPVENYDDMKKSGFMAAFVPEELGGLGLTSVHDWCVGMDRLARGDASTAIAVNMHLAGVRTMLQLWHGARLAGDSAAEARHAASMREVTSGNLVLCGTATEPGTDNLRPLTTATRIEGGWSITGRKIFVTLSPIAQLCNMSVRVTDAGGDRLAFATVPTTARGFEPQDDWDALGMRASGSQSVVFNECLVPEHAVTVVGAWGRWSPAGLIARTVTNLVLVAVFLGIAERARELAVEAATKQTKTRLGGPLGLSPGVQHLLGQIDIELAAARAVLDVTSRDLDAFLAGPDAQAPALEAGHAIMRDYQAAKWTANQNAISIVSKAMDIAGGGAYMTGNELSRLYRDVRAGPFMQPFSPTELQQYVGQVAAGIYPEG